MFDEDTMIEVKVVMKDDEENPTHATVPMTMTLAQLAEWVAAHNAT